MWINGPLIIWSFSPSSLVSLLLLCAKLRDVVHLKSFVSKLTDVTVISKPLLVISPMFVGIV